jgi:hypothetical protein
VWVQITEGKQKQQQQQEQQEQGKQYIGQQTNVVYHANRAQGSLLT